MEQIIEIDKTIPISSIAEFRCIIIHSNTVFLLFLTNCMINVYLRLLENVGSRNLHKIERKVTHLQRVTMLRREGLCLLLRK